MFNNGGFFTFRAEVESRNYRQMAKLNVLPLDDTDEEWEQERKEAKNKSLKCRFY